MTIKDANVSMVAKTDSTAAFPGLIVAGIPAGDQSK